MKKLVVYSIITIRALLAIIKLIPFGALVLYIVSDLCVFLFDKLFLTIGTFIAFCSDQAELKDYWKENAIINDVKLNVSGKYVLNGLLRRSDNPESIKFGHRLHTISDTMGRLKLKNFGQWWDEVFLEAVDKGHTKKAVQLGNKALLTRVQELGLIK